MAIRGSICFGGREAVEVEPLNGGVLATKVESTRPRVPYQAEEVARVCLEVGVDNEQTSKCV